MYASVQSKGRAFGKVNGYLQVVPITLIPLKDKAFKVESAGEEKVGEKPAAALKVTGPDGKDFTLLFDKDELIALADKYRLSVVSSL